jgi:hypothetical protein
MNISYKLLTFYVGYSSSQYGTGVLYKWIKDLKSSMFGTFEKWLTKTEKVIFLANF